jgi:SAM-dependent methyltransferase
LSRPSWYLDPLVAAQKQAVHLDLVKRWMTERPALLLKTDLFEEANGADQLLFELGSQCEQALGLDINIATAARSLKNRPPACSALFCGADVRSLPFRDSSLDLIISNSTLDHFNSPDDFTRAISELARVLRPGGCLIVTVDNVLNPLYWPLRWLSWAAPFRLGYSPMPGTLTRMLEQAGLAPAASAQLIHNPRLVSTLAFLALRRLFGDRAAPIIKTLLNCFAPLEHLPTRRFTACFWAIRAIKPDAT